MKIVKFISIVMVLSFISCKEEVETPVIVETPKEVVLETSTNLLTVINVMKPDSIQKAEVLTLLQEGTKETMAKRQGFVSSNIHSSLDNRYIINYAQWETGDDLQAAADLVNSGGAPKMGKAFSMSSPDFHPYQLVEQYNGSSKPIKIDEKGELLTIVNILKPVDGVTQDELIGLLKDAMKNEVLNQSGFISTTIHKSLDNDLVINYSQWKDGGSLQGMVARVQSGDAPKLGKAFGSGNPDFHPYSIVKSIYPE